MVEEFNLPMEIIDRKVTKMKMISPSNREVDVGKTLSETEYIGMCRREVFDDFLRKRAIENGAQQINGLMMGFTQDGPDGTFKIKYNDFSAGGKVLPPSSLHLARALPCVADVDSPWRSVCVCVCPPCTWIHLTAHRQGAAARACRLASRRNLRST